MPIRSMTGYGLGSAPLGAGTVHIEVRSLNHRFVEVRVRVPTELGEHAFYLEQQLRAESSRGRFDVTVRSEGVSSLAPHLDLDRARAVYAGLCLLRDELTPGTDLPIGVLASVPELIVTAPGSTTDESRASLSAALSAALQRMNDMRKREGEALARELTGLLTEARSLCASVSVRAAAAPDLHRARLRDRIERFLAEVPVELEQGRLETEVAFLADRSDVAEELARLQCHFDEFGRLLEGTEPVGRRLDFLLQEIARESNTIGAKSADAALSHLVVELKSVVERMREQVQNVE